MDTVGAPFGHRDAHPGAGGSVAPMLDAGTEAPDFTLPDQDGQQVALGDMQGRWVLLWWYPKAATPG
jgi:cytochrome oxidase Cu insertion factor (SCO1/SenC/PrrC family)